jgi:hypothetical protein
MVFCTASQSVAVIFFRVRFPTLPGDLCKHFKMNNLRKRSGFDARHRRRLWRAKEVSPCRVGAGGRNFVVRFSDNHGILPEVN